MPLVTNKINPPLSRWRGIPRWRITVTDGVDEGRVFHLPAGSTLTVGSNPNNGVVLQDGTASRAHAELVGDERGVRVRDLHSTNGCWLDGSRIFDAVISAGVVKIGSSTLTIASEEGALEELLPERHFGPMVGHSAPMRALFQTLSKLAKSNSTVLMQAESGTGKELVARAVHEAGERRSKPYVVFDCASVTPSLFESALFGHEKGSFTGAESRKVGCFEEARGGTLFLDEIGELPLDLQSRLLRAVESREIRRVGGDRAIPVDVRLLAATHRDLATDVSDGAFREDLYYRLAVVRVRIPPLRERLEDLRVLVEHLATQVGGSADPARGKALLAATTDAHWAELRKHPWRGNVRELRNAVERAMVTGGPLLPSSDMAGAPTQAGPAEPSLDEPYVEQRQQVMDTFERKYLQLAIERHQGNFSRAAAAAGIDRMYFKRLLKRHGLVPPST